MKKLNTNGDNEEGDWQGWGGRMEWESWAPSEKSKTPGVNRIDPPNIVPQVRPFGLNPAIRFSDKIVSSSEHR